MKSLCWGDLAKVTYTGSGSVENKAKVPYSIITNEL